MTTTERFRGCLLGLATGDAVGTTATFEDAILMAANLGDDADTTAAVCGQVAGAYYGERGIPTRWLDRLAMRDAITTLADQLDRSQT